MLVYIKEAHAIDSKSPMFRGPVVEDPVTTEERFGVASKCVVDLGLDMIPAVIDKIDNKVGEAWQGWPDRLYLVGTDGKLSYAGGKGPFGFNPDELEAAIRKELAKKAVPVEASGTPKKVRKL